MSIENPLWGAPRIHGELLKLGFEVAQSTVATLIDISTCRLYPTRSNEDEIGLDPTKS
jgi:hypothetical protein